MLIILGGLPATGKTTLAKTIAKHCHAVYLRIDTIEQKLAHQSPDLFESMPALGYQGAYQLATDNLLMGQLVIADSVNPITRSRSEWCSVAINSHTPFLEIEIICSDPSIHRHRVENRNLNQGHVKVSWQAIMTRDYEPWQEAQLVIDTAKLSPQQAFELILPAIKNFAKSTNASLVE